MSRSVGRPTIALIGAGQMGSSHARVIAESNAADLGIVIDQDVEAASRLAGKYWSRSSTEIADAMKADAVIIASSTATHLDCGLPFLEAGIPTFIEKPLAPELDQVLRLIQMAERRDVPLMCGFVERFNAAFRTAAQAAVEAPTHVLTVRHSPPAPRIASSVVSDMLLHDLDIVISLFGRDGAELAGAACYQPEGSNWLEIADCTVMFAGGMANLSANRMGQRKVRSVSIHSPSQLVEVDLLRQNVTVYRNVSQEMTHANGGIGYRSSTEIEIPFVRHTGEPLALQFGHFLDLLNGSADHAEERARILPPHTLMDEIERARRR